MTRKLLTAGAMAAAALMALNTPSFAAYEVNVDGQSTTHCSWTAAASVLFKAAQVGEGIKNAQVNKLGENDTATMECQAERALKRKAKPKKQSLKQTTCEGCGDKLELLKRSTFRGLDS
ncbi:MAG: hypothetical protein AAFY06_00010 [Pseudomonadota bacterium]